jgi:dynein heavy chain
MKFGVDLFKIQYVPSPDLEYVEKEIANLEKVWKQKDEWDSRWEGIQKIRF